MSTFVFHPITLKAINLYVRNPVHASLLIGTAGSGKATAAQYLAGQLLDVDITALASHPYFTVIAPVDTKAIPIDSIRGLQHTMTLKIPGKSAIARVVIIEDAHMLTTEAQNALLKTLEEPPLDTVLILTATSTESLLPTVQSRLRVLRLVPPSHEELRSYLQSHNFPIRDIDRALLVSGGLPGLTHALLTNEEAHPLHAATEEARALLKATVYGRLLRVDTLSKQRELCRDTLFILSQMSRMALMHSSDAKGARRWQRVMKASLKATELLRGNTGTKLVLTSLMLEL